MSEQGPATEESIALLQGLDGMTGESQRLEILAGVVRRNWLREQRLREIYEDALMRIFDGEDYRPTSQIVAEALKCPHGLFRSTFCEACHPPPEAPTPTPRP